MAKLVIVESPSKARTIEKYLGKDYKVAASVGHVVDLPKKKLGVDLEHNFEPDYEVLAEKKKAVAELKKAARSADEIFLAPDPDREGEAIAWHIANLLRDAGKPMHRVLINEITKPAVLKAISQAGEINQDLFEAQQARRILDRLVGYLISPMLSRKFKGGLSAGRVQSVALRLVVERERAIRAFLAKEYWSLEAKLNAQLPPPFKARLVAIGNKPLEAPERFDKDTNLYVPLDPAKNTYLPDEAAANKIMAELAGKPFTVGDVVRQERRRYPLPPFITSTIQQEASRKLGYPAKKTMQLAQRLYEGIEVGGEAVGLITYMRTDAPRVAEPAVAMARDYIQKTYGRDYLPATPPTYKSKKGAQEAHEAIRPTAMDRTPEAVKPYLDRDSQRLYELIFLRFVASQMMPAVYDQTTVELPVGPYLFRAGGRVVKFKGFLAVYEEAVDDEAAAEEEMSLPPLEKGQTLKVEGLLPEQHFTRPPARFTEATLVKELEERGIGRPSTYAAILSTIQDRKYVEKEQKQFAPTALGERVIDVLVAAFPDTFEVKFTAKMEEDLDRVEDGQENWVELLRKFYGPFSVRLAQAPALIDSARQQEPTDLPCPLCGKELMIKWSRKGEFIGCSGYPECRFTGDLTREPGGGIKLIERTAEDAGVACDKCGSPMVIKKTRKDGREFLACGNYPACRNTRDFARDDGGKIVSAAAPTVEATGIECDKCGSPMVIRKTRRGGQEFLACSAYPKCKNAKDFIRDEQGGIVIRSAPAAEDTGIACDKCGKPMVVRRSRAGKEFLSCSTYPKCKNAKDFIRDEQGKVKVVVPGDQGGVCEKCGKPMVLKRSKRGTFWACSGYPECNNTRDAGAAKGPGAPPPTPLAEEPPCELCGRPMVTRQGRWGPFIACSGYPECKNIRKKKKTAAATAPDSGAEPKPAAATDPPAPKKAAAAPAPDEPPCELCGRPMVVRQSRYGPFISCSGYPQCKNIRRKKGEK
jgi:DNA topoisomerase I